VPPTVVEFRGVAKSYPIYSSPSHRLKELLFLNRKSFHRDFWALHDISFDIRKGETFCVIGENGSGKSTLLQIIAGILQTTRGHALVRGRVAALLELGSGFNPEFSGRDNVYLNGAILGLSRKDMDRKFPEIEQFAEIGNFIEQPVKTYSSGMAVRLAFAVAIHVDPEILLVDEALAVGDIYFRQRCMRKVHELRERGITIVFVSHAIGDVKSIGDRAMWLDAGRIRDIGDTDKVTAKYMAAMAEKDSRYLTAQHTPEGVMESRGPVTAPEIVDHIPHIDHRHGDRRAEIIGIAVLDPRGAPIAVLEPSSEIIVRISVRANEDITLPNVGFMLRNHMGLDFAGTNTMREDLDLPPMHTGDIYTVDFRLQLPELYPSAFSFSPAIADGTLHSYVMCDWIDNAITLQMINGPNQVYGYVHLPCRVELNRRLGTGTPAEPLLQHAESPLG
jgi:ABC-type polysaccharide/polyol phosphate transport system ATPase subunit